MRKTGPDMARLNACTKPTEGLRLAQRRNEPGRVAA
jgi:hypothetical protein